MPFGSCLLRQCYTSSLLLSPFPSITDWIDQVNAAFDYNWSAATGLLSGHNIVQIAEMSWCVRCLCPSSSFSKYRSSAFLIVSH